MYSLGDDLTIKIFHNPYDENSGFEKATVTVIGFDFIGSYTHYVCYVPQYEKMPRGYKTFKITETFAKKNNIHHKFIGEEACHVTYMTPIFKRVEGIKGEACVRCKEFFAGAERKKDSSEFRCHQCIQNPFRLVQESTRVKYQQGLIDNHSIRP